MTTTMLLVGTLVLTYVIGSILGGVIFGARCERYYYNRLMSVPDWAEISRPVNLTIFTIHGILRPALGWKTLLVSNAEGREMAIAFANKLHRAHAREAAK